MRGGWFGKRLTAVLTPAFGLSLALGASSLSAAQQRQINQVNPDLDTEDQLAPSQMKQPLQATVCVRASIAGAGPACLGVGAAECIALAGCGTAAGTGCFICEGASWSSVSRSGLT